MTDLKNVVDAVDELMTVMQHDAESCSMADVDVGGTLALEWVRKHSGTIEAALTRLQSEAGQWLPIESAPIDGSWIAAKRMGKRPFCVRWICESWQDENNLLRDPTHFYTLPTQPRKRDEQEG